MFYRPLYNGSWFPATDHGLRTTDYGLRTLFMCDHWMPLVKLSLTMEQFHQLPRNGAYKYEYIGGQAYLSPRPRHYHALLELQPRSVNAEVIVRPVVPGEGMNLARLFAASFGSIQPFGDLDDATRLQASRESLARVLAGGDGPFIERASFVAVDEERTIGAILVTLLPDGDPCDHECYEWREKPPTDCIEKRLGRPHLKAVFAAPDARGNGIGTALLAATINELLKMGYKELLSTFMIGNELSTLWHWR